MIRLAVLALLWPASVAGQAGHDIVVLGEVHDNPAHHARQAEIVAALSPAAVVWEMLPAEAADRVAAVGTADGAALAAALGWQALGWPEFAMYHPIFVAAGEAVHIGAAVGRDDLRAAMQEGAAAVFGPEAAAFGLVPLDAAEQAEREAGQASAHCDALPAEMLPGMVEAQRLRDAAFARAAIGAFETHGGPVVVITGTGHARTDRGVPAAIAAARPGVSVWALGQLEAEPEGDVPFDAVAVDPAPARPDPCADFH
jgi:uncharacterized iron-regulated protein